MFSKEKLKVCLYSLTHLLHKWRKQAGRDGRGKEKRLGGPKGRGNITSQDILITLIGLYVMVFFFWVYWFSGRNTWSFENMVTKDFSLGLWPYLWWQYYDKRTVFKASLKFAWYICRLLGLWDGTMTTIKTGWQGRRDLGRWFSRDLS